MAQYFTAFGVYFSVFPRPLHSSLHATLKLKTFLSPRLEGTIDTRESTPFWKLTRCYKRDN